MSAYVDALAKSVLQYWPEQDRELLRENLERLGSAPAAPIATPLDVLHRQDAGAHLPAAAKESNATLSREVVAGRRRLSLFLSRLQPQVLGMTPEHRGEVASQFMAAAAPQRGRGRGLRPPGLVQGLVGQCQPDRLRGRDQQRCLSCPAAHRALG